MTKPPPRAQESLHLRIEKRQRRLKVVRYALFLPGMLIGAITGIGAMIWPPVTHVESTGLTRHYEDIQPLFLRPAPQDVLAILDAYVAADTRFAYDLDRHQAREGETLELHLIATPRSGIMRSDVQVTIRPSAGGQTVVNMRSTGSGPKTDFGQNARNIRHLQDAIREGAKSVTPP